MVKFLLTARQSKKEILEPVASDSREQSRIGKTSNPKAFLNRSKFKTLGQSRESQKINFSSYFLRLPSYPYSKGSDGLDCFFMDEVFRINTLEQTDEWKRLCSDLAPLSNSLVQILLNKTKILEILKQAYVGVTVGVALDLTLAIIRDLKSEVFGDFVEISLQTVIGLLTNDQFVDNAMRVLSGFSKYCFKDIIADESNVIGIVIMSCTDAEVPRYVLRILAEMIGVFVNKSSEQRDEILRQILLKIQSMESSFSRPSSFIYFFSVFCFSIFIDFKGVLCDGFSDKLLTVIVCSNSCKSFKDVLRFCWFKLMKACYKNQSYKLTDNSHCVSQFLVSLQKIARDSKLEVSSQNDAENMLEGLLIDTLMFKEGVLIDQIVQRVVKGLLDSQKSEIADRATLIAMLIVRRIPSIETLSLSPNQLLSVLLELIHCVDISKINNSVFSQKQNLTNESFGTLEYLTHSHVQSLFSAVLHVVINEKLITNTLSRCLGILEALASRLENFKLENSTTLLKAKSFFEKHLLQSIDQYMTDPLTGPELWRVLLFLDFTDFKVESSEIISNRLRSLTESIMDMKVCSESDDLIFSSLLKMVRKDSELELKCQNFVFEKKMFRSLLQMTGVPTKHTLNDCHWVISLLTSENSKDVVKVLRLLSSVVDQPKIRGKPIFKFLLDLEVIELSIETERQANDYLQSILEELKAGKSLHRASLTLFIQGYMNRPYLTIKRVCQKILGYLVCSPGNNEFIDMFSRDLVDRLVLILTQKTEIKAVVESNDREHEEILRLMTGVADRKIDKVQQLLNLFEVLEIDQNIGKFHADAVLQLNSTILKIFGSLTVVQKIEKSVSTLSSKAEFVVNRRMDSCSISLSAKELESCPVNPTHLFNDLNFYTVAGLCIEEIQSIATPEIMTVLLSNLINNERLFERTLKTVVRSQGTTFVNYRTFFNRLSEKKDVKTVIISFNVSSIESSEVSRFLDVLLPAFAGLILQKPKGNRRKIFLSEKKAVIEMLGCLSREHKEKAFNSLFKLLGFDLEQSAGKIPLQGGCSALLSFLDFLKESIKKLRLEFSFKVSSIVRLLVVLYPEIEKQIRRLRNGVFGTTSSDPVQMGPLKKIIKSLMDLSVLLMSTYTDHDFEGLVELLETRMIRELAKSSSSVMSKVLMALASMETYKISLLIRPSITESLFKGLVMKNDCKTSLSVIGTFIGNLLKVSDDSTKVITSSDIARVNQLLESKNNSLRFENLSGMESLSTVGQHILIKSADVLVASLLDICTTDDMTKKSSATMSKGLLEIFERIEFCFKGLSKENLEKLIVFVLGFMNEKSLKGLLSRVGYRMDQAKEDKRENRIKRMMRGLEIMSLLAARSDPQFFLEQINSQILPIMVLLEDSRLIIGVTRVIRQINLSTHLLSEKYPGLSLMTRVFVQSSKITEGIDQIEAYDTLSSVDINHLVNSSLNVRPILVTLLILSGSSELSLRSKAIETLQTLEHVKDRPVELNLCIRQEVLRLTTYCSSFLLRKYSKTEQLKGFLMFFETMGEFFKETDEQRDNCPRKAFISKDMVLLTQSRLSESLFGTPASEKNNFLSKFQNDQFSEFAKTEFLIPLFEQLVFSQCEDNSDEASRGDYSKKESLRSSIESLALSCSHAISNSLNSLSLKTVSRYVSDLLSLASRQPHLVNVIIKIITTTTKRILERSEVNDQIDVFCQLMTKALVSGRTSDVRDRSEEVIQVMKALAEGNVSAVIKSDFCRLSDDTSNKSDMSVVSKQLLKSLNSILSANSSLNKTTKSYSEKDKKKENEVKLQILACYVPLVKLLPLSVSLVEVKRISLELSYMLRQRSPKLRKRVLKVLGDMARNFGPFLLPLIYSGLRNALKDKDNIPLLSYCTWYVFQESFDREKVSGCLDAVTPALLDQIVVESFSAVQSEEKEKDMKGTRDMRKLKGRQLLSILVSTLDFSSEKVDL